MRRPFRHHGVGILRAGFLRVRDAAGALDGYRRHACVFHANAKQRQLRHADYLEPVLNAIDLARSHVEGMYAHEVALG